MKLKRNNTTKRDARKLNARNSIRANQCLGKKTVRDGNEYKRVSGDLTTLYYKGEFTEEEVV